MGCWRKSFLGFQSGFSLTELLICIAIVGALASVFLPTYDALVQRVRETHTKTLMYSIYKAEKLFFVDHGSYTSRLDALGIPFEGTLHFDIGFDNDFAPPPTAPQGFASCRKLCHNNPVCGIPKTWTCAKTAQFGLDGVFEAKITVDTFVIGAHAHYSGVNNAGKHTGAATFGLTDQKRFIKVKYPY